MVIGRRSLLLAGVAVPVAAHSQCVTDTPSVDACLGGVRITQPPGATLDLGFFGPTLDPSLTFTRGSTATYFDVTGTMRTAAINAPRFDNDPVTHAALGLLIEEQRTNLIKQSADLSNAAWSKFAATSSNPVVTANATTAPDGTLTAALIAYPAVSGAGSASVVYQQVTGATGIYSVSAYLKGQAGGEQLYMLLSSGGNFTSPRLTLTTSWQRYTFVTANIGTANPVFEIGTDLRDVGEAATLAQTIFAWGVQVELAAFPTSYIPSVGAAVTRSADVLRIPPANMGFFVSPGGSWMAEFIEMTPTINIQNGRIISQPNGAGSAPIFLAGAALGQFDGAAILSTANTTTPGAVLKGASTWAGGTGTICLNGGAVATGAMSSGYAGLVGSGIAFLVTVPAGNAENETGYMRRVRYWPRVLSNAELQSVTR